MGKSLFYRLFGAGKIPGSVRNVSIGEGVVVEDEGISGYVLRSNFRHAGRYCKKRKQYFAGFLIVTRKRVIAYSFSKCLLNISLSDRRVGEIEVCFDKHERISLSFSVKSFHENSDGFVDVVFKTPKASGFYNALVNAGFSERRENLFK